MFNMIQEMNWIAIIITTLAFSVLGGVWFTLFFGKAYAYSLGKEYDPKEKPKPIFIIGPFVCGLITAISMSILIYALNINSVTDALIFGFIVGVGFLSSTTVNTAINPNIPRPLVYGLISGGYFSLASLIGSMILFAMK